jgi:hypothetical protein
MYDGGRRSTRTPVAASEHLHQTSWVATNLNWLLTFAPSPPRHDVTYKHRYGAVGSSSGIAGLPLPVPTTAVGGSSDTAVSRTHVTLAISSDLGRGTPVEKLPALLNSVCSAEQLTDEPVRLLPAGASGYGVGTFFCWKPFCSW